MEKPDSIYYLELTATMGKMGLTQQHDSGPFLVFLDQMKDERVMFHVEDKWNIPAVDIDRALLHNNLDVDDFWEKRELLYSNESTASEDDEF